MKVFELFFSDYDGVQSYKFIHSNPDKGEAGFKYDIHFILKRYQDKILEPKRLHDTEEEYIDFIGVEDFVILIAKHLPELGYEEFSTIGYGFTGSNILGKDGRPDDPFTENLTEELKEKVYKHNDKIRNQVL